MIEETIASGHVVKKVGVLSPVAEAICRPEPTPISARLKSLRGAKIVFVGNSLESTKVLHDELKRLLLEHGVEPVDIVKKYWRQLEPTVWYPPHARASGNLDDKAIDGNVPVTTSPENILVVVAGGGSGSHSTFIPTFADSEAVSRTIVDSRPG